MSNKKNTQGEWIVKFMGDDKESDFFIEAPCPIPDIPYGIEIMMDDYGDHNGYTREQRLADAELIAEAGNVTNESGFTPRELLEQRDSLLEALNYVERTVKKENINDYFDMKIIVRAINKSKGE